MEIRDIQMIYTIDNPKLVRHIADPEEDNFTGVVRGQNNCIAYYENGKFHRTNGPAIIYADGTKYWYIHGESHREDGPAVVNRGNHWWYYKHKYYGKNNDFTVESWVKKWKLDIFK